MNKQSASLAAAAALVAAASPAAAWQANRVHVDVSGVVNRLGLDLATVSLDNNVVLLLPPAAASVCGATTSELAYQQQQGGRMSCKAKLVNGSLKKAAKAQAKPKAAAQ